MAVACTIVSSIWAGARPAAFLSGLVRIARRAGGPRRFFRSSVMPGLVPLLSGLTSERALCRQAGPSPPLRCHPGLDPGSRKAGRVRCLRPPDRCPGQDWTPDQVRGDSGGTGRLVRPCRDPCPDDGGRAAETSPVRLAPCPANLNRTAYGTSPGMTTWEQTGRCARQRKGAPASPPAPPLPHCGKYGSIHVPGQEYFSLLEHFLVISGFPSAPLLSSPEQVPACFRFAEGGEC